NEEYFVRIVLNVNWINVNTFYYYSKEEDSLIQLKRLSSSKGISSFSFEYVGGKINPQESK
ncbi:MAG: hypothetical protein J6328_05410, partial [Bacilli bacterium]|nr:hypothetical protein [Bacilli bacterium]